MKKWLLIAFTLCYIPTLVKAQVPLKLKFNGIKTENYMHSDDRVMAFPLVLVYEEKSLDSAMYLSCFATIANELDNHFDGQKENPIFIPKNKPFVRDFGLFQDSIQVRDINGLEEYTHFDLQEYKQVIVYYWSSYTHSKEDKDCLKHIKKIIRDNPEKKVKLIVVDVG